MPRVSKKSSEPTEELPVSPATTNPTAIDQLPTFQERTESSIPIPTKSKSTWHSHRRSVIASHPELSAVEQTIMAKKTYTPPGRARSAQSIHREAFLLRNPNHGLQEDALNEAIRKDLLARI